MKTCLVFHVLLLYTITKIVVCSSKPIWGKEEEICIKELNLNKQDIQALNIQRDILEYPNEEFNNFLICSWKKKGFDESDGEINWDKIYQVLFDEFQTEFQERSRLTTLLGGELVEDSLRKCRVKFDQKKSSSAEANILGLRRCVSLTLEENLNDLLSVKDYTRKLFSKIFTY